MTPLARLIASTQALVDSVSFDENGSLIGGKWMGGNGGLISPETHARADEVRRALDAVATVEANCVEFRVADDGTVEVRTIATTGDTMATIRIDGEAALALAEGIFGFHGRPHDSIGPTLGNG